jgi:hypothetical protein
MLFGDLDNGSYVVVFGPPNQAQSTDDSCFVGGTPRLPIGIEPPICSYCQSLQAFFFQVAFPGDHPWAGRSLAVFQCVACIEPDRGLPRRLPGDLYRIDVPAEHLNAERGDYRYLVFDSGSASPVPSHRESVLFRRLTLRPCAPDTEASTKIGGRPTWIGGDEGPATLAGLRPIFLFQFEGDFAFETHPHAPRQALLDIHGPSVSSGATFSLFSGYQLYLFGTSPDAQPLVYDVVQRF